MPDGKHCLHQVLQKQPSQGITGQSKNITKPQSDHMYFPKEAIASGRNKCFILLLPIRVSLKLQPEESRLPHGVDGGLGFTPSAAHGTGDSPFSRRSTI